MSHSDNGAGSRAKNREIKSSWAYQRKFQSGDIILNTGCMLGYRKADKDENGHDVYEIVEEEAEIVRRIYREYLAGISITRICSNLETAGIKTKFGREKWRVGTVESILTNEKYTGNALLGKTYKADVLSRTRQKNDGKKAPIYLVEGSHPAIIEPDMFELVKKEMQRRRESRDEAVGGSRYTSKYPFSGLLECGICGHKLRRHVRTMGNGAKVPAWACTYRVNNDRSVCDSHHVREDVLEATYLEAMRTITKSAVDVIDTIRNSVDAALNADRKAAIAEIDDEIIRIQTEVLELHKSKRQAQVSEADYAERIKAYSETMKKKDAQRAELQESTTKYTEIRAWLDAFDENINTGRILTVTDSEIMRSMVERIIVKDDGIEIHLKCGVSIGQAYVR